MNRTKGLHRESQTEQAKAEAQLDRYFSRMIRERDAGKPCIVCDEVKPLEAGHFRKRGDMSTRWNYQNVNGECQGCNRQDRSGFGEGKGYEYSLGLDRRWGRGTAKKLYKLSMKIKSWEVKDLIVLTAAAKMGARVYQQVYDEMNP